MKRRLRALLAAHRTEIPNVDMIIEIREDIAEVPFAALEAKLLRLLARVRSAC